MQRTTRARLVHDVYTAHAVVCTVLKVESGNVRLQACLFKPNSCDVM